MGLLPEISTKNELCGLIEEIGFLPLFRNDIPGFSVYEITKREYWFEGDPEKDPWEWREQIAAEGAIAYGKFFGKKAGFISKGLFPAFANIKRAGYDFDSLYEEGLAARKSYVIMKFFENGRILPSYEIRRLAGFGGSGEKGFEGALAALQSQTYLTVRGFVYRRNMRGEPYGWSAALYSTPEALFGYDYVRSEYGSAERSIEKVLERCMKSVKGLPEGKVRKLITR